MPILTQEQAKALLTKVLSYSKADECEVNIEGSDGGNVRYARNSVNTSGGLVKPAWLLVLHSGKNWGSRRLMNTMMLP